MPRLRPTDVAHSAVTDHSIPRKPGAHQPAAKTENTALRPWREPAKAYVDRDLGVAYFDLAATTHAERDLLEGYRILSHLPPRERQDAAVEADLGSILLAEGQTSIAIQMFERALSQDPSNVRYAHCLGTALERAGRIEEAVQDLKRSVALDPSQQDAYLELAKLYRKSGHAGESRNILRAYLRFMPQNIQLRLTE